MTDNNKYMQNRELSWLKFNQRVLEEASDPNVPLFERLKFLSIFTSNLDEFFMIRVGTLTDLYFNEQDPVDKRSGLSVKQQLNAIFRETKKLYELRDTVYKDLHKTLTDLQIADRSWKSLNRKEKKYLQKYFREMILPLLSPQIMDFHHPFPHLVNQQLYVFVELTEKDKKKFGIVPIPSFIDSFIKLPDSENNYVLAEQIICHNLEEIFTASTIKSSTVIRVTRNADIDIDDERARDDEDYLDFVKNTLKKRSRLAALRLEVYRSISDTVLDYLCRQLHIERAQVFVSKTPLELKYLFKLISRAPDNMKEMLEYKPFVSQPSKYIDPQQRVIDQVLDHDVLLNYPYQNVDIFLDLLKEASTDPNVMSIKITIYRLATPSRILDYLIRARENGKEVTVLMELRARFDENNNIQASQWLEEAGCTVLFGFEHFKVHSKICLITLKTKKGLRMITQVGTGNYNEKTARQYTDLCYMTADETIGKDAVAFFQNMALANVEGSYNALLVAPVSLKQTILKKLDEQIGRAAAGRPAEAAFKINSISDIEIMKKLSEASQAGVKITMVVRGICCILPGIPNKTEHIEVYSIVGRFLEHSRIYMFGPEEEREIYIASADFMTRNTDHRVEVAVPIADPLLKADIEQYFDDLLRDNVKRRRLASSGNYEKIIDEKESFNSQQIELERAARQHDPIYKTKENGLKKLFHSLRKRERE